MNYLICHRTADIDSHNYTYSYAKMFLANWYAHDLPEYQTCGNESQQPRVLGQCGLMTLLTLL